MALNGSGVRQAVDDVGVGMTTTVVVVPPFEEEGSGVDATGVVVTETCGAMPGGSQPPLEQLPPPMLAKGSDVVQVPSFDDPVAVVVTTVVGLLVESGLAGAVVVGALVGGVVDGVVVTVMIVATVAIDGSPGGSQPAVLAECHHQCRQMDRAWSTCRRLTAPTWWSWSCLW